MNLLDTIKSLRGPAKIPTVILDGSGVAVGISFRGVEIPLGGLSADDLRTIGFVEANASNQLLKNGVVISGTPTVANQAALPDVATYSGFTYRVLNQGLYGVDYQSNGTVWSPVNGSFLAYVGGNTGAAPISLIWPATTWNGPYTLSSAAAGAETLITCPASDFHGLTSAMAVGRYINVSAGTGTNVVGLQRITAIAADTTGLTIQIAHAYNASDTITAVTLVNGLIPIVTKTIPVLRANSIIQVNCDVHSDAGAVASTRTTHVKLGSTTFTSSGMTSTTGDTAPISVRINNVGATNIQRGSMALNCTGYVTAGSTAPVTGAIDTSVETTLVISADSDTANIPYELTHYEIYIRG